jgi:hypothetical protein
MRYRVLISWAAVLLGKAGMLVGRAEPRTRRLTPSY